MRDRVFIGGGLVAFLVVATFPVWYNVAARANVAAPALARPANAARVCVAPREFMRASHMQLLVTWREDVVRRGDRVFVADDGRRYEKNLTATCLGCHEDKARFCDRCHDYAGVSPRCPDCHVAAHR